MNRFTVVKNMNILLSVKLLQRRHYQEKEKEYPLTIMIDQVGWVDLNLVIIMLLEEVRKKLRKR